MNEAYEPLVADGAVAQTLPSPAPIAGGSSAVVRLFTWLVPGGLALFDVLGIVTIVVLGVMMGYYSTQTNSISDTTARDLQTNFNIVRLIQERAPAGVAWYDFIKVPGSCLDPWLVRQQVREGLRP